MSKTKKKKFLPVSTDIIFKNLFGVQENSKYTSNMLERLLDYEAGYLEGIEITNDEELNEEVVTDKLFETDIYIKLKNEETMAIRIYNDKEKKKNEILICGEINKNLRKDNCNNTQKTNENNTKLKNAHEKELIRKFYVADEEGMRNKKVPMFNTIIITLEQTNKYGEEVPSKFINWMKFLSANTKEELYEVAKNEPILMDAYKECIRFMELDYVQNY